MLTSDLADDVLNFLGPSLKDLEGCDIIDLHPGACLWSTKLHDVLKPRRHLLMEPDERYFEPFIKPLLEQPDSKYRHTTLSGAHPKSYWDSYRAIFDDELLAKRAPVDSDDPALRKPNNKLLVTGFLHRKYDDWRKHNYSVNSTNLIVSQMAFAALNNTLFHTWGLVRMLFWVPEDTTYKLLPRSFGSVDGRKALDVTVEMAADVTEVVNTSGSVLDDRAMVGTTSKQRGGFPTTTRASLEGVLERMEKANIQIPEHRQTEALKEVKRLREREGSAQPSKGIEENLTLEEEITRLELYADEFASQYHGTGTHGKIPQLADVGINTFDISSSPHLPASLALGVTRLRLQPLVTVYMGVRNLEDRYARELPSLSEEDAADYRQRIVAILDGVQPYLGWLRRRELLNSFQLVVAETKPFQQDRNQLPYEKRPYEALKASKEEFFPQEAMSLLDIRPRSENFASDIISASESAQVARDFIMSMFHSQSQSIVAALERIAPNAAKDLIPQVPAITDPEQGGRLDPNQLAVRCMSTQMFVDLVKAFLEWPFRPSNADLAPLGHMPNLEKRWSGLAGFEVGDTP